MGAGQAPMSTRPQVDVVVRCRNLCPRGKEAAVARALELAAEDLRLARLALISEAKGADGITLRIL